jgi:alkaline phosphatase
MKLYVFFYFLLINVNGDQFKWYKEDENPKKWINNAKETIDSLLKRKLNGNIAKNLILFLGDGMGIPTVTAGRIRKGQIRNNSGEEEITFMESLGNVALAKVKHYFSFNNIKISKLV